MTNVCWQQGNIRTARESPFLSITPLAPLEEEARWRTAEPAMRRIAIEICREPRTIEAEWLRFQGLAAGTFFQTYQ